MTLTTPQKLTHDRDEWNGITPQKGHSWRHNLENREKLLSSNRIVVKDGKCFEKKYWHESGQRVSNNWKNEQSTGLSDLLLNRLAELFFQKDILVFCPFERDGCFSRFCNDYGVNWISATASDKSNLFERNFERIPDSDYVIKDQISDLKKEIEYSDIVAGTDDINRMKEEMNKLVDDIHSIQETLGLNDNSEEKIEDVLEKIHNTIIQRHYDYESYKEAAKKWINPYWSKLEIESQCFIPTGILLSEHLSLSSKADMAPALIEYCKSFERELFMKMFKDYAEFIINTNYEIPSINEYEDNEQLKTTKIFIEFLRDCKKHSKKPDKWKLEIGPMKYILELTLEKDFDHPVINDYKAFLKKTFDLPFFELGFLKEFSEINKMRNDCAHPRLLKLTDIKPSTDLIRDKIIAILQYKK